MKATPILPAHIADTVQAIAEVHLAHHRQTAPVQRLLDRMTNVVGRPSFVVAISVIIAAWVALNLILLRLGRPAFDTPPFQWLQDAGTLLALYITILILITQRRENLLTEKREQLTLELAILSEQKSAKIIRLLEEMRRDHPQLRDRVDTQADEMGRPADPHAVLEAISSTHAPDDELE